MNVLISRLTFFGMALTGALAAAAPQSRADTPAAAPAAASPAAPTAAVAGFRSAHFGMDETAVKHAIHDDFGIGASDIKTSINPYQQTGDLSVTVPSLADSAGKAVVDYVFGYKSHKLVEVNVTWSTALDATNTPTALLRTTASLQSYFESEGFPPAQEAANLALPGGAILAFRGIDSDGHAVLLTLAGPLSKPDSNKHVAMTPAQLSLVYAADPAHPDVYGLPHGAF